MTRNLAECARLFSDNSLALGKMGLRFTKENFGCSSLEQKGDP